jgi:predicted nucleotidyltransferase
MRRSTAAKSASAAAVAAPAASGDAVPAAPRWEDLRPEVTDALLADVTRRIVEAFHPHKIILFGSYAYGTPTIDSDVDLLVVMNSDEPMTKRMTAVKQVAMVPFLAMDVLVYTPVELEKRLTIGCHFMQEVLSKGRVLYERDAA